MPTLTNARRHDIDAIRVIAFALLILYHVAMFYVADWGWHVKSDHLAEWLQWPMIFVNRWRMALLFLVSGLAVHFLLRHVTAGRFAWERVKRLLVPLLFGMAVVVPPQAWTQAMYNGAFDGSYAEFLVRYLSFQPWPEGAFDGWYYGITWNHLWYLPYLLCYTLVLAALLPLLGSRFGLALRERFTALRGVMLAVLPALPLTVATWLLSSRFPDSHDLINDWHNHAVYFTIFLYGYWIGTREALWAELKRLRWPLLLAALASFAAFALLAQLLTHASPDHQRGVYDFFEYLYAWIALLAVLAWGHTLLNRPFRWLTYANEAVYPWYVLHQTVTVVAGYQLSKLALGPVVEPVLLVVVTVLGCFLLHEFVIRRVNFLRPLFGVKALARGMEPRALQQRA